MNQQLNAMRTKAVLSKVKRALTSTFLVVVLTFVSFNCANAQIITWNAIQNISGDSDVADNDVYVDALYINSSTALTVNGVTFNDGTFTGITNGVSVSDGIITIDAAGGTDNAHNLHDPALSASSSNYQAVVGANLFNYYGGLNAGGVSTISFSDLNVNQEYQVEIWANSPSDPSNSSENHQTTTLDGVPDLDNGTTNNSTGGGQFIIGTFTADASTATIDVTPGTSAVSGISAVSIEAVPEPSSQALFLMGVFGILFLAARSKAKVTSI